MYAGLTDSKKTLIVDYCKKGYCIRNIPGTASYVCENLVDLPRLRAKVNTTQLCEEINVAGMSECSSKFCLSPSDQSCR